VLTPAAARGFGSVQKAVELAQTHGWFLTRQFENEANADMHSRTTAKEILEDFKDMKLDYWVTGFGTGGTLRGVARVLTRERPETQIIVCEPADSPLLSSGIEQQRNMDGSAVASHPASRPHQLQGWSPDFIAKLTEDAIATNVVSQILTVNSSEAMHWSRELARQEGIFVGITSGATFAAAVRVSQQASSGSTILCMLPDTGERYLSTSLFADVSSDMTEQELEISRSTPSARF
jgi:cysteine synthase